MDLVAQVGPQTGTLVARHWDGGRVFNPFLQGVEQRSPLFVDDFVVVAEGEVVSIVISVGVDLISESKSDRHLQDIHAWQVDIILGFLFDWDEVYRVHLVSQDVRFNLLGYLPERPEHILLLVFSVLEPRDDPPPTPVFLDPDEKVPSLLVEKRADDLLDDR